MVRLQVVGVKDVPEEVRRRQAKTLLEVGDEDDSFAGFRCRRSFPRR
jgi:hypothetical protein